MAKQPNFLKIDFPSEQSGAIAQDQYAYKKSDDYARNQFPDLYAARDNAVETGYKDLINSGSDPLVNATLKASGLEGADLGSDNYQYAINTGAKDILAPENRARNYFSNLFQQNPKRQFGLNLADVAAGKAAETGNKASFGSAITSIQNQAAQAEQQNRVDLFSGISSALGSIGKTANAVASSPYLNATTYSTPGYSPAYADEIGLDNPSATLTNSTGTGW